MFSNLRSRFALFSPAAAFGIGALAMLVVVVSIWLIVRANRTGSSETKVVQTSSPTPTASTETGARADANAVPTPSPSPQVLLALNDGANRVGIDEHGNLVGLESLPPANREMVKNALIAQQPANLAALAGVGGQQGGRKAGQGAGFAPFSPVGKIVLSTTPTLRWSKLDGASEYRVEIYGSNSDLVASSPPLTSTSWVVMHELEPGKIYSWQVTATKNGEKLKTPVPPAPESRFKILDVKQAAELTTVRKDFASSHLALGVLYAQFGLLDEAEREFAALSSSNPQSDIARKLLSNVKAAKTAGMK